MKPISFAFILTILVLFAFSPTVILPSTYSTLGLHPVIPRNAPATSTAGAFAFVSNFESFTLEGWQSLAGPAPKVVKSPNYFGEPSLASVSKTDPQVDFTNQRFVSGDSFVSFQVAINVQKGSGYFGLMGPDGPVAVIGVSKEQVYAGQNPSSAQFVQGVPSGTAYPSGWVYITANVYDASSPSNPSAGWVMQLFVDRTDVVAATVSVPSAGMYSGALIDTTAGVAYYTDIVVSTYEIPINIPSYNNMDGYGQGSGLLVNLLPAFYNLTAQMKLNDWSTPQVGILSFQINAMNYYGTTTSSCVGFFQLGVDLNPNGTIAPWYVPGKNCFAHYFLSSQNPAVQPGVPSPKGTKLVLSIVYDVSAKQITFTIRDLSTSQVFTASIPYSGTAFFGTYTQLEFQPCCNQFPIQDYMINGKLYDMQITMLSGSTQPLPASYMLPFILDAPPSWSFTYYQNSSAGYTQLAQ